MTHTNTYWHASLVEEKGLQLVVLYAQIGAGCEGFAKGIRVVEVRVLEDSAAGRS
jgi:hypothetical protein